MVIFQKFCIFALKRKMIDEDEIEVLNKIIFLINPNSFELKTAPLMSTFSKQK